MPAMITMPHQCQQGAALGLLQTLQPSTILEHATSLLPLLSHGNHAVADGVATLLRAKLKPDQLAQIPVQHLLGMLTHQDWHAGDLAAELMGQMPPAELSKHIDQLVALLHHPPAPVSSPSRGHTKAMAA